MICPRSQHLLSGEPRFEPRVGPAPPRPQRGQKPRRPPRSVSRSQHTPLGDFQEPCLYSQESQKFSCQLAVPEGDNSFYIVSLCLANHAGSASSRPQTFEGYEIRE